MRNIIMPLSNYADVRLQYIDKDDLGLLFNISN